MSKPFARATYPHCTWITMCIWAIVSSISDKLTSVCTSFSTFANTTLPHARHPYPIAMPLPSCRAYLCATHRCCCQDSRFDDSKFSAHVAYIQFVAAFTLSTSSFAWFDSTRCSQSHLLSCPFSRATCKSSIITWGGNWLSNVQRAEERQWRLYLSSSRLI